MSSWETEIASFLEAEGATALAAGGAAAGIAARWKDREFWLSATLEPVEKCAGECPGMAPARDVVKRLEVAMGVRIHDVPEWEPGFRARERARRAAGAPEGTQRNQEGRKD